MLIRWTTVRRLGEIAKRTETLIDDFTVVIARRTRPVLVCAVALHLGASALDLPARAERILEAISIIALFLQLILWSALAIDFWIDQRQRRSESDPASATTLSALKFLGKLVLGAVLGLVALDSLGVQVTTLIAGLGVGGLAIALATQNILADLFGSLTILIDKPFVLGDTIRVDDLIGSVEEVGLKTTRVRSLSGEQLIFSNGDLLKSRLRNYGRMKERRVPLSLKVALATPPQELAAIPARLQSIVEREDDVRFDRAHVKAIGLLGIELEVIYYVTKPEYLLHMDRQQAILLAALEDFAAHGINLPSTPTALSSEGSE